MKSIENTIRSEFPGEQNKALRAYIRKAAQTGNVMHLTHYIGLTASGLAGLKNVQAAIDNTQKQ